MSGRLSGALQGGGVHPIAYDSVQFAASAGVIRRGGTLVTIAGPTEARPIDGLTIDFVLVSDRAQLSEIVQRVRDGRLRPNICNIATLDEAVAAFNPTKRIRWK